MESWSFDTLAEGKMGSMDWESKSPFIFGNNKRIENQGFRETCLPQLVGSSLFSPVMAATHNVVPEEHESSSGLSSSVVESNSRESGVFDFITKNLSSAHVRKKRLAGLHSPSPFCQVHGCTKSLICSKDYHKRHKVCELHSKTAKVIVNGIEQRFCQQCSRFHLLSEFDDGKRSCRKRLADHNERRRKPQVPGHSGRHGRLLPSYNGSKFKGSTRTRARSSTMSPDIYHIKREDQRTNDLQSMSSTTDVHLLSESRSSSNVVHQYPSLHGDNNGYTQASNYVFVPFPNEDPTGGAEDFITMNSGKTALYLLSSPPSQGSSSCQSSRNPTWCSHPLIMSNNMNPDNGVWSGDVSTIDLLQLSSQLERVELQKEIFRNKCKNGASFGHSFT